MRISIKGGGCSGLTYDLNFNVPEEDDLRLDLKGVQVIIDPISLQYLTSTEIDYIDGLNGSGFKIENPNAKRTCGCGNSFSTWTGLTRPPPQNDLAWSAPPIDAHYLSGPRGNKYTKTPSR